MPYPDEDLDNDDVDSDGTLDSAVRGMPDFDQAPAKAVVPRAADGKFARQQAPMDGKVQPKLQDQPVDKTKQAVDPKAVEAQEDDEDWLEIPAAEEGKDPERVKLDDVWQGYQKAKELEGEVQKLKSRAPLPVEVETVLTDTVQQRARYMQGLEQLHRLNRPVAPDRELINPQSQKYDPEAYYRQDQQMQRQQQLLQEIEAEHAETQRLQEEQVKMLEGSIKSREQQALYTAWPELRQPETKTELLTFLDKTYGIDQQTVRQVNNHKFYLLARDAMKGARADQKTKEAVKVVRAKPKLVRGTARQASTGKAQQVSDAMSRLSRSGSIDDAADAIGGLLN